MARLIFLDGEPLGLASQARGKPKADTCRGWLQGLEMAGARILIPEIVRPAGRAAVDRVLPVGVCPAAARSDGGAGGTTGRDGWDLKRGRTSG